jgi:hypothetical protein
MNYGFIDKECINLQAKAICDALGNGKNGVADKMIIETAIAETALGKIEDKTKSAGMGICQFDKMPFYDIRDRNMHRQRVILKKLGVDISLVEWEHLRYSSFLSLLFCRLFYKLIPYEIPLKIEDRARYWKKHYNTELGKGSVEHFMEMNNVDNN